MHFKAALVLHCYFFVQLTKVARYFQFHSGKGVKAMCRSLVFLRLAARNLVNLALPVFPYVSTPPQRFGFALEVDVCLPLSEIDWPLCLCSTPSESFNRASLGLPGIQTDLLCVVVVVEEDC